MSDVTRRRKVTSGDVQAGSKPPAKPAFQQVDPWLDTTCEECGLQQFPGVCIGTDRKMLQESMREVPATAGTRPPRLASSSDVGRVDLTPDERRKARVLFDVRDGDVLVVSYPEVTIPIAPYASVKVGGLIYTRKLVHGDDIGEEYDRIYAFLQSNAEADAAEKVQLWAKEMGGSPGRSSRR